MMSQTGTLPAIEVRAGPGSTRALLACGTVAAPLFAAVVFLQAATRTGFDLKWHPVSLLSLGGSGWIQVANFVVTGSLYLAGGVGVRRALRGQPAGTWAPRLIGVLGGALVWAGIFSPDPYHGFPPGAPAGYTWHGLLHSLAPPLAFLAVSVACLVFARRFWRQRRRGWLVGCLVVWLALGIPNFYQGRAWFSLALMLAAVVGWGWLSLIMAHLTTELEDETAVQDRSGPR
jgi:hypothetical protein